MLNKTQIKTNFIVLLDFNVNKLDTMFTLYW